MLQSNRQLLLLAGLLGIVLTIVGQAITLGAPMIDEGGAEIQAWLADNRAMALTSVYLLGLGIALLLALVVVIYSRLRTAEGGAALMSAVFLVSGVAAIGALMAAIGIYTAAAYRAESISAETAGLLTDMSFAATALAGLPTAIGLLAAGRVILQTRTLPVYIGYLALLGGVVHLVTGAAYSTGGGFNLQNGGTIAAITFYLFAITAAITLLRQREEETTVVGLASAALITELGTLAARVAIVEGAAQTRAPQGN